LKSAGVLTTYSMHFPISDLQHSETRFNLFDPATNKWNFDWKNWEQQIEESPSTHSLPRPSILHELDDVDIKILRELSVNARAERKGIAEKVGLKDYELSRRLRFLEANHLISYFRLVHETGVLGIAMTVVLKCKASMDQTGKFLNSAHLLPFQGSVYPLEDGFLMVANMPPGEVTSLVTVMQKHCESVGLMWGDYSSSMKYFFDNDPSNFTDSGWSTAREYMVEAPLRSVAGLAMEAHSA
jgi:DNA-binding Lrp family transcriptional regulator